MVFWKRVAIALFFLFQIKLKISNFLIPKNCRYPDKTYDSGGCYSGSITIVDNGTHQIPVISYTGKQIEKSIFK